MIITILIPTNDDGLLDRAVAALTDAGIGPFEAHLQTWKQHAEHPLRSSLLEPIVDAEEATDGPA